MKKIILLFGVFFITLQLMDAQIIVSDDTSRRGNYTAVLQAIG